MPIHGPTGFQRTPIAWRARVIDSVRVDA